MDPVTIFGAGAVVYTVLNFIPARRALETSETILEVWRNMGVCSKDGLYPVEKNGAWFLPYGLAPKDIEKTLPALEYQLNAKVEMEIKGKAIFLHIVSALPTLVEYERQDLSNHHLGLVIGQTQQGLKILDLDDSHPYIIVGGMPGTGKSNFLNQSLIHITQNYCPAQVLFWLIDLKLGVELGRWEASEFTQNICFEQKHLKAFSLRLYREIRQRMKLFRKAEVFKIDEYNALDDVDPLPYLLLVIDEYAEARRQKDFEEDLQSILQIGRASGLRCLLATQRPSADNISTSIRGLIADRLCFQVADRTNSEIILDRSGAELLPDVPGRCILLTGAKFFEAQVMRSMCGF